MTKMYAEAADWLDRIALRIKEIEKCASSALYELNDEQEYRRLMKEKALLLASLSEEGRGFAEAVGGLHGEEILSRLDRFSASASKALEIGSVFFMSALLYPEEYTEGEPNDLERFAQRVRSMV